jgi:hypothetical protein
MYKLIFSLLTAGALVLTGCLETTQEITLKADGSGTIKNTSDLSALIGLAKQMGGGAEMEKMAEEKVDSTFSLDKGADSIPNLTPDERELAKKGTANIKMSLKEEKFSTSLLFPFSTPSEIALYNKISAKISAETMKEQMGNMPLGGDEMPEQSSFDDYYIISYANGLLTKVLNKEKYASAANDEYLKGVKEASAMGLPMKATYIINLPKPAIKAEGKGIQLSDDKKKVTVTADIDDFFDDPSKLEYRIEY